MKHSYRFLIAVLPLLAVSCAQEFSEGYGSDDITDLTSAKFVNTKSSDTADDEVLVMFASAPEDSTLSAAMVSGVAKIERVFPVVKGKEEIHAQYGFDKWYTVSLEDDADVQTVAQALAKLSSIETVEYSRNYRKASDCVFYPLTDEEAATELDNSEGISLLSTDISEVFNDPQLSKQWNFSNAGSRSIAQSAYVGGDINIADVWSSIICGDPDIIVAVLDEGVKYTHPDLEENMWTNPNETDDNTDTDGNGYVDDIHGWNFYSNGPITWSKTNDSGHGTHCAGIIAAVNNNGVGISGVAGGSGNGDGVKIMSCQIFDNSHTASPSKVANAFRYAADNGASVVSCSFGYASGTYLSDAEYRAGNEGNNAVEYVAIKYFEEQAANNNDVLDGGIAIFAAGNEQYSCSTYPGGIYDVISVSSYGPDFLPTYYTNYGDGCNICAPGGEAYLANYSKTAMILSTLPSEVNSGSDYGYEQGTSMACPHVSGIAALGLAYAKKLGKTFTVDEFKSMLLTSTKDIYEVISSTSSKNYDSSYKQYITSTGYSIPVLSNYEGKMGSGAIDAWQFMMKIEGTPCIQALVDEEQALDISSYMGDSYSTITFTGLDCSSSAKTALGLTEDPYIENGLLIIHPTKCGSVKMTVTAIAGGTAVGGDTAIGGMEISQDVSVIVRSVKSSNGGWL